MALQHGQLHQLAAAFGVNGRMIDSIVRSLEAADMLDGSARDMARTLIAAASSIELSAPSRSVARYGRLPLSKVVKHRHASDVPAEMVVAGPGMASHEIVAGVWPTFETALAWIVDDFVHRATVALVPRAVSLRLDAETPLAAIEVRAIGAEPGRDIVATLIFGDPEPADAAPAWILEFAHVPGAVFGELRRVLTGRSELPIFAPTIINDGAALDMIGRSL